MAYHLFDLIKMHETNAKKAETLEFSLGFSNDKESLKLTLKID